MRLTISCVFLLLTVFCFKVNLAKNSHLVGLLTLSRHGEKTPTIDVPNDTHDIHWSAGTGQLLNTGKVSQYELGKWFRKRYGKFLPEKYSPKDIRVQAIDEDRVLMSAYCTLAGLYPPKDDDIWMDSIHWQPIPVHIMPKYYLTNDVSTCKSYASKYLKFARSNPELYSEKNKKLYQYISTHVKDDVSKNLTKMLLYYDTLYIEKINGYELPKWADPIFDDWAYAVELLFQSFTNTTEFAQMSLGGFVEHIIKHFDSIVDGTNEYKYSMNFSHDGNIAGLLNVLANNLTLPSYGSTIFFELRKDHNRNTYFVRTLFKNPDEPIEVQINGCDVKCDYESFRELLKKYAVSEDDWNDMCLNKK